MTAYPSGSEEDVKIAGRRLLVRPIRATDLDGAIRFVHELSADAAYHRFFSSTRELSTEMARRFTDVDYHDTMAFIATECDASQASASDRMVGVARYAALDQPASCEFAVTIADSWQRRGLGRLLMERLIAYARSQGLAAMTGSILAENHAMRELARSLGFAARTDSHDPATITVDLVLFDPQAGPTFPETLR